MIESTIGRAIGVVLIGLSIGMGAGCGADDDSGNGSCTEVGALLDRINETTHCENGGKPLREQCESGLRAKPGCANAVRALLECARAQAIEDWDCHEIAQYPALKTSACTEQNTAVGRCFGG